jgi:hypothetical protein
MKSESKKERHKEEIKKERYKEKKGINKLRKEETWK